MSFITNMFKHKETSESAIHTPDPNISAPMVQGQGNLVQGQGSLGVVRDVNATGLQDQREVVGTNQMNVDREIVAEKQAVAMPVVEKQVIEERLMAEPIVKEQHVQVDGPVQIREKHVVQEKHLVQEIPIVQKTIVHEQPIVEERTIVHEKPIVHEKKVFIAAEERVLEQPLMQKIEQVEVVREEPIVIRDATIVDELAVDKQLKMEILNHAPLNHTTIVNDKSAPMVDAGLSDQELLLQQERQAGNIRSA